MAGKADVTGPLEVFTGAEHQAPGSYRIRTASLDGASVRSSSGPTLVPDTSLTDAALPHTFLVPGGRAPRFRSAADRLAARSRTRAERLVSVCT